MPRWGKSVSRRRHAKIGHICTCGCGQRIDERDAAEGRFYIKIGHRRAENNPLWLGPAVRHLKTARDRAGRLYPVEPCEMCGNSEAERHHRDGNVNNNERANIAFLCRKHHMETDRRWEGGIRPHLAGQAKLL